MNFLAWIFGSSEDCRLTFGERKIMENLEKLKAGQVEILNLLAVVDAQVEAMFEVIKNQDVPVAAAAELTAGLEAIKAAAVAVGTDDEPVTPPAGE